MPHTHKLQMAETEVVEPEVELSASVTFGDGYDPSESAETIENAKCTLSPKRWVLTVRVANKTSKALSKVSI